MAFIMSTVIGSAGDVIGTGIKNNAIGDAAQKQDAAANSATALQKQIYDQQRADQQPYMQAGTSALSQMQDPSFQHSFGASDFQADPGYAFRMSEGQKALERSAAAKGGLQSGGFMKGLADYSQGLASQEYGNAYNRFTNDQNNRFGRLSTLAGMGQGATNQVGAFGSNYAGNVANIGMSNANAQAGATMAQGNNWGNTVSGIGDNIANTMNLNSLMKGKGYTSAGSSSMGADMGYGSQVMAGGPMDSMGGAGAAGGMGSLSDLGALALA